MTELKPCPFCGGEARIKTWCDRFGNWNANLYCINVYGKPKEERCQAEFFMRSDTQEKVIEEITSKWNKRPNPWHTGTPTEEGWYLLECKIGNSEDTYFTTDHWSNAVGYWAVNGVIRWQKIDEYKEKNKWLTC
jgi:hypothetical protein